jgi:type II secretory ATPase GspE/PulE/Tfp pilus assembly ATPase PilB-like protein
METQTLPSAATSSPSLGQVLLEAKLISLDQLQQAEQLQRSRDVGIGTILIENGWVSPESLAMALSLHLNLPIIDLKRHVPQATALSMIPEEVAREHILLPLDLIDETLAVVMEDPTDLQVIEELTARSGKIVTPMVGVRSDIQTAIDMFYKASGAIEKEIAEFTPFVDQEQQQEGPRRIDLTAEDPVVRAVDLMLEEAVQDRASDIHISPDRDAVKIRYRIDGVMRETLTLPRGSYQPMLSRIKVLAGMNIAESRRPQDGQFSVVVGDDEIFFRVATSDTTWGEMAVLRVLGRSETILDLAGLGFDPRSLETFQRLIHAPFGMVLVAGPTGSGKTTTLYAAVNQLDHKRKNIMTIEDPVEYNFSGVNQIQVNRAADITFGSGLRAIMRLDPDVILVGEIRDRETAETAIQAALTGHLVLSSIHANDSPGALFRLGNLGVENHLMASAVTGIVSQRLVRKICPHCKVERTTRPEDHVFLPPSGEQLTSFHEGEGCNFCTHSGYKGRTGVFEVMPLREELRQLLLQGASTTEMKSAAVAQGMIPMFEEGMRKVKAGITTPQEVVHNVYTLE